LIALQQETGKYTLPATDWVAFRSKLISTWNNAQGQRYVAAQTIYRRLIDEARGARGFDYRLAYASIVDATDSAMSQNLLDPYGDLFGKIFTRMSNTPREPHEQDYPLIGARTVDVSMNMPESGIVLKAANREAHWTVNLTGDGVERARLHGIAVTFFNALSFVKWTAKTGGYVLFTEETPAGSGNLTTATFIRDAYGPLGAQEVAARARATAPTSPGRIVKPGMR
jgi:hypothetical protein